MCQIINTLLLYTVPYNNLNVLYTYTHFTFVETEAQNCVVTWLKLNSKPMMCLAYIYTSLYLETKILTNNVFL